MKTLGEKVISGTRASPRSPPAGRRRGRAEGPRPDGVEPGARAAPSVSSSGDSERRDETVDRPERERVARRRRARGKRERRGRLGERVERLGANERAVGHHDEDTGCGRARRQGPRRSHPRGRCPRRGGSTPPGAKPGSGVTSSVPVDAPRPGTRLENPLEHVEYEPGSLFGLEQGRQARLRAVGALHRDDRQHAREDNRAGRGSRRLALRHALSLAAGPEL